MAKTLDPAVPSAADQAQRPVFIWPKIVQPEIARALTARLQPEWSRNNRMRIELEGYRNYAYRWKVCDSGLHN